MYGAQTSTLKGETMKAKIIRDVVNYTGSNWTMERILIPEINLAISFEGSSVMVTDEYTNKDYDTLREVDVSDELVKEVQQLLKLNEDLVPQISVYLYQ